MTILTVYKKIITDDPSISARIDNRVYIEKVEQNSIRPNILLQMPESGTDYTHDGPANTFDAHIKVTVRVDTDEDALQIGRLVTDLLSPWKGTEFDLNIMLTELFNEKTDFDSSAKVFEHVSEYTSFYRKV